MADLRISELPVLNEADLQANDDLAVVDYSASETRRLTAKALVEKGVELIDDDSIPGGKIAGDSITAEEIAPDAIGSSELADDAVDTAAIEDLAVTTDKLDDQGVTTAKIADDAVTGPKLGPVTNRGLDQAGDLIGITNSVTAGSLAGLTFTEQGLISAAASEIPSSDLPEATDTEIGAIKPGAGLAVQGDGTLDIDNSITANDIGGLSFTAEGLCDGFPAGAPPVFERDAIPIAGDTATETGAVFVPTDPAVGLELDATTGELGHEQSGIAAGLYAGVQVDENGHITAGTAQITSAQLPDDIPAADIDISDGKFPTIAATSEAGFDKEVVTEAIDNESIGRRHFNDISTAYIQETQPPSVANPGSDATAFRGCLWFRETTGQLYMFNGNAWHIVAGGRLAQENLRYMGNIDASNGNVVVLTDEGVSEQDKDGNPAFAIGSPLPIADDTLSGCYFLIETAGSSISVDAVTGNAFTVGDLVIAISEAAGWAQISGAFGSGGGGGSTYWDRSGSGATAILEPSFGQDNVDLSGSDFMRLPQASTTSAPSGSTQGSVRWNPTTNYIEVWDGTQWLSNAKTTTLQWETIAAAANADWTNDVIRTKDVDTDLILRMGRSLLFEAGSTTDPGDSGDNVSRLYPPTLTSSRTWTLPDETGTVVTTESTVVSTDNLTIDCGNY